MRAFGFGPGRRDRPRAAQPAAPQTAPGYLASLTTAPYAVWCAQRLVPGYTGPLFRLRRASDGATQDFAPPSGGDYPDRDAIAAWAGGSALTVAILHDQTGNGRHLTQATAASQPGFDPARLIGNAAPILFDGQRSTVAGPVAKWMALAGQNLSRQNLSVVDVQQRQVSLSDNNDWLLTDDGSGNSGTNYGNSYTNSWSSPASTGLTLRPGIAAAQFPAGAAGFPLAVPDVTVATFGAANLRALLLRGSYHTDTSGTVSAQTIPGIVVGRAAGTLTSSSVYTYNARSMRLGLALYPALEQADAQAVAASLRTAFGLPASYDYRLVLSGDSIMEGSGAAFNGNMANWLLAGLTQKAEVFNTAVHGTTMQTIYANRAAYFGGLVAGGRPNVIVLEAGTNDLTTTSGSGTTAYASYTAPLIAYLKGLGFQVIACTLLPRQDNINATLQSERTAYNGLVTANAAGADHVLDLTQHPVMGASTAPNDTTLFVDKLHPTALGHRWLAGAPGGTYAGTYTYRHALEQVLGATP